MDPSRQTPAPPDKESYSYEEMMERLRQQRSSQSRRVKVETEDGTIEIKKRKRRSHQPKKQRAARLNRLRKIALLTAIPAVLIVIGLYLFLQARYQGEAFRRNLSERSGELLGAPTELAPLVVKGLSVSSRRILISPSNSFLRDAELVSLSGRLTTGSLFSRNWNLTSATALHARFNFRPPGPAIAANNPPNPSASRLIAAGLGLSSHPEAIHIERLIIDAANFSWTSQPKAYTFLENAKLVSRGAVGGSTAMSLSDATFRLPDWPEFQVEKADVTFSPSRIRIDNGVLTHHYIAHLGGDASLAGQIDLAPGKASANFICEFEAMPIKSLVKSEWKDAFDGDVDATLNFTADLADLGSLKVEGPFWIRNGSFGDIIPVKRLAAFLAEPRISRVSFHSIKGHISIAGGSTTVTELNAVAPDLVHVTGNYSIGRDGLIEGELKVGVADKVLGKIPGGKPAFFDESDAATSISYTSVKLSGTNTAPLEDLTSRLEAALEQYHIDSAAPPASSYPTLPRAPGADQPASDDPAKRKAEENFKRLIEP